MRLIKTMRNKFPDSRVMEHFIDCKRGSVSLLLSPRNDKPLIWMWTESGKIGGKIDPLTNVMLKYPALKRLSFNSPSLANLSWRASKIDPSWSWSYFRKSTKRNLLAYPNFYKFKYDVNSLYPFCSINSMPGRPIRFNLSPTLKEIFGFVNSSFKVKTLGGGEISGQGWIFSEELKALERVGAQTSINYAIEFAPIRNPNPDFLLSVFNRRLSRPNDSKLMKDIINLWYGRLSYMPLGRPDHLSKKAWAQSIISYARMSMIPFNIGQYGQCYSFHIDSVKTRWPIPPHLLGRDIGNWKQLNR